MRQSIASAALIQKEQEGKVLWLAQWSRTWHCFHLVGGHKRPDESFRECLVREIGEELGLREGADYEMAAVPTGHMEFTAWSQRTNEETAYTMELFEVRLHDGPPREKTEADPENRWLSEAEIRSGRTTDGKPVSPTMAVILGKIQFLAGENEA